MDFFAHTITHTLIGLVALTIIGFLQSFHSNWMILAQHYKTNLPIPKDTMLTWQTITINSFTYQRSLRISSSQEGLYLSMTLYMFILRPSHPTLFIPWSAITKAHPYKILVEEYKLYVDIPNRLNAPIVLSIPRDSLKSAEKILAQKWSYTFNLCHRDC